jgi:hypothetical protein
VQQQTRDYQHSLDDANPPPAKCRTHHAAQAKHYPPRLVHPERYHASFHALTSVDLMLINLKLVRCSILIIVPVTLLKIQKSN